MKIDDKDEKLQNRGKSPKILSKFEHSENDEKADKDERMM